MRSFIRNSIVAVTIFAFSTGAGAATTVPFTFTSGTPAKASEVNADFQALATAIDALSVRIDKLDGTTPVTAADLAGSYSIELISTTLSSDPTTAVNTIVTETETGTATFAPDGTYTFLGVINRETQTHGGASTPTTVKSSVSDNGSGTWSLSNGKVIFQGFSKPLAVLAGGRALVGSGTGGSTGQNVILLLIRN